MFSFLVSRNLTIQDNLIDLKMKLAIIDTIKISGVYMNQDLEDTFYVISHHVPFMLKVVTKEENEPLIEFYDQRYIDEKNDKGQFINRYEVSLLNNTQYSLQLQRDVVDWFIDKREMDLIRSWLQVNTLTKHFNQKMTYSELAHKTRNHI